MKRCSVPKKYASPDFVRERRTTTKPDLPAAHGSETPTANCRQVRRHGHAPPGCGTIVAYRAHVWSVRCTVSAFPAGYAVRQVFRLGQFIVPRLITFPCVPTVAAACPAACKPGPAVTAAVPHRYCTCFPILPASLAAPDTLQLLCAYQHIIKLSVWQTKSAAEGNIPSRRFYRCNQRNSLPSSA